MRMFYLNDKIDNYHVVYGIYYNNVIIYKPSSQDFNLLIKIRAICINN
jgi:hypothetical protein